MRVPATIQSQYRLAFRMRGNAATLYECHGPWDPKFPKSSRRPVAQFRYLTEQQGWALYWADPDERWHLCNDIEPTPDLAKLLDRINDDPMAFFFG